MYKFISISKNVLICFIYIVVHLYLFMEINQKKQNKFDLIKDNCSFQVIVFFVYFSQWTDKFIQIAPIMGDFLFILLVTIYIEQGELDYWHSSLALSLVIVVIIISIIVVVLVVSITMKMYIIVIIGFIIVIIKFIRIG